MDCLIEKRRSRAAAAARSCCCCRRRLSSSGRVFRFSPSLLLLLLLLPVKEMDAPSIRALEEKKHGASRRCSDGRSSPRTLITRRSLSSPLSLLTSSAPLVSKNSKPKKTKTKKKKNRSPRSASSSLTTRTASSCATSRAPSARATSSRCWSRSARRGACAKELLTERWRGERVFLSFFPAFLRFRLPKNNNNNNILPLCVIIKMFSIFQCLK